MTLANKESERVLPPHPAPNMLDLFMTRYDYDYNRDVECTGLDANDVSDDDGISGEVRNRPIFRFGNAIDGNYDTTYRTDYTEKDRRVRDVPGLIRTACGEHDAATSYARGHYRPDLTKNCTSDGSHPLSVYKADYTLSGPVPKGDPQLYAGARTTAYNPDFLLIPSSDADLRAEAELPPKITSKDSLLPRIPAAAALRPPEAPSLHAARRPQLTVGGPPTDYYCTSWVYGDKSLVYPSQLPHGIEESPNAHLIGTIDDTAVLLAKLAGRRKAKGKTYPMPDETNPVLIPVKQEPFCAVTRRIENEGHVKMSMYKSDYINQGLLPELPDAVVLSGCALNDMGGAPQLACSGEMLAGSLTRNSMIMQTLRNSHGNLLKAPDETIVDYNTWRQMKTIEKRIGVDKADPHRHKLR